MNNVNRRFARGFTLMEMLVTIALVVMIITGVGILTQNMGKLVSTSQGSNELLSNVRAAQSQIENDILNLDRNGFLIIRGQRDTTDTSKRYDMMSFLAVGNYPNRTGTDNTGGVGNTLFSDSTVANGALVWYGQCMLEKLGSAVGGYMTATSSSVGTHTPLSQLPSGTNDQDYILGRRSLALMAAGGTTAGRITLSSGAKIPAFATPDYNTAKVAPTTLLTDSTSADVTSSRISVAAQTNQQVMMTVMSQGASTTAYNYCYRLHVLQDIYGANDASYPTNYYRIHPQLLQGCSSFGVDWTNGDYDINKNLIWYGSGNPKSDGTIEPGAANSDDYCAVFSYDNRAKWPKAIRVTMRVTDRNLRLSSARDFVLVVRIPG